MFPRRLAVLAVLLLALAAACGSNPPPKQFTIGGIAVEVTSSPAKLRFLDADGTDLLDGLPGGAVASGDKPEVAAAFATGTADYQMLYGSFKITDHTKDWQGVTAFKNVRMDGNTLRFDLEGPRQGGTGSITATADRVLDVTLNAPGTTRSSAAFRCHSDEHFMGFGAQSFDVDHRGFTVPVWVSEQGIYKATTDQYPAAWFLEGTRHSSYFSVPFFVSSRGFGLLAHTVRRSIFAMCSERPDVLRVEAWQGKLDFNLFFGKTPLGVIKQHSDLVGRAPVPPDFTFAPWNDAVFGSANVRRVASELRANHIPSSMIWTEDWGGAHDDGKTAYTLDQNWTIDRTLYPDAEKVAADLHALGFKWMAYFNTFVAQGDDHYGVARPSYLIQSPKGGPYLFKGVTFRPTSMVDLTNPAARDWMAGYMNKALDIGFDGWMADYSEWVPTDAVLKGGSGLDIHNIYPVLWQKLNDQVFAARKDGVERLDFVRSGYTGSQEIGHQVVWGGDQTTDFDPTDGLPTVVPIGIGLGVVGMPYYGSDIAGYISGQSGPTTKELFFRWAPVGALSPIMRTHHGREARANWFFDTDADTLALWKRYAILHTRLFPYFEAQARLASKTGAPIMRGLGLDYPQDGRAWGITDEYLLGPDVLVAPVLHEGKTSRSVYFPAGSWIPLGGGRPVVGPATRTVAAPLGDIPVYAHAGSVLVLLPPGGVDTLAKTGGPGVTHLSDVGLDRTVWAYLGAKGSFTGRAGDSYTLASGGAPGAAASLSWNGAALPTCDASAPAAPCATVNAGKRTAVAYIAGDGTLDLDGGSGTVATLETAHSSGSRKLTVRLFW